MPHQILLWSIFGLFVIVVLALDLGVFHRRAHVITIKEALKWSAIWVALALIFNLGMLFIEGTEAALKFFTGYLIEYSLSVDNLFVFLLIFSYFRVPLIYQHKVLFWGILGAVIMRLVFIVAGITLIHKFHWIIYVFGTFLVFTGAKMVLRKGEEIHPERNPILKLSRRFIPITHDYVNGNFFVKLVRRFYATPLFVVLLVVESTDVVFALDSIPAILAITTDPTIVYTSNVFAVLGLRSLFFALAGLMQLFYYLRDGVAVILVFVGVKMLVSEIYKIPVLIALGVIVSILVISILASYYKKRDKML